LRAFGLRVSNLVKEPLAAITRPLPEAIQVRALAWLPIRDIGPRWPVAQQQSGDCGLNGDRFEESCHFGQAARSAGLMLLEKIPERAVEPDVEQLFVRPIGGKRAHHFDQLVFDVANDRHKRRIEHRLIAYIIPQTVEFCLFGDCVGQCFAKGRFDVPR
jgi:hypothetical protein